jgi:phosphatidylserine/phosphatidylglycerophosphate/cardiolipin synthase-like enzyme
MTRDHAAVLARQGPSARTWSDRTWGDDAPGVESPSRPVLIDRHASILRRAVGCAPVGGNRTRVLVDGPATHAAMFEAIGAASDHVNIESYIVEDDGPGRELAELLIRKRAEGVRVNLIYDAFGSPGCRTPASNCSSSTRSIRCATGSRAACTCATTASC